MSKTGDSKEKSMAKVIKFINQYPNDWVQKAFGEDTHLADHLQSKWEGYARGKDSSYEAIVKIMTELSEGNREKLMEYIDATFEKGGKTGGDVKDIVSKYKPVATKHNGDNKEGYSVLVKDKNSDFFAWVDVHISSDDVVSDWNKYIFNLKDAKDVKQKALQENSDIFESATSEAIDYLEKKGLISQDEKGLWHYGKSSGGSMSKGGGVRANSKYLSDKEVGRFIDGKKNRFGSKEEFEKELNVVLSDLRKDYGKYKGEEGNKNQIAFYEKVKQNLSKHYSSGGSMSKGGEINQSDRKFIKDELIKAFGKDSDKYFFDKNKITVYTIKDEIRVASVLNSLRNYNYEKNKIDTIDYQVVFSISKSASSGGSMSKGGVIDKIFSSSDGINWLITG